MNSLINFHPEAVVKPYKRDSSLFQGSVVLAGGSIEKDTRMCPITALPYAKLNIPATNIDYQKLEFNNLTPFRVAPDDTWLVSVYIPELVDGLTVQLLTSKYTQVAGTEYRWFTWAGNQLQKGYNILSCLHAEDYVNSNTYGHVGTNMFRPWGDGNTSSSQDDIGSITIRVKKNATASDVNVSFGSIYRAKAGWAKSYVALINDDAIQSFTDLCLPIVEEYGWKITCPTGTQYSADGRGTYTPLEQIRDKFINKGHEVWTHLRQHENMLEDTYEDKERAIKDSVEYWKAQGIKSARYMGAWPHGHYDDDAVFLAKKYGLKLMRSVRQGTVNPLVPAVNPYNYSGISAEQENSWQVDSLLNGVIKRGDALLLYFHSAVEGGANSDVRPSSLHFYVDHLRRWFDLLKEKEEKGLVEVGTVSGFFDRVGVSPLEQDFLE